MFDDYRLAGTDEVTTSPQLFLPAGSSIANPGITVHWQCAWAKGFPVIDNDDPTVYETMLISAATDRSPRR